MKIKILIVDDSRLMREKIRKMAVKLDYDVVGVAVDGAEAIEKYKYHHPDIVTMDISMPNVSGIKAAEEIMRLDPDANIIMISAVGQKKMVLKALEIGAKHFINKPFEAERFNEVVQIVLCQKA